MIPTTESLLHSYSGTAIRLPSRWHVTDAKLQLYLDAKNFTWPSRLEITAVTKRLAVNIIGVHTKILEPGFTAKVFILSHQPFEIVGEPTTRFDYIFSTPEE